VPPAEYSSAAAKTFQRAKISPCLVRSVWEGNNTCGKPTISPGQRKVNSRLYLSTSDLRADFNGDGQVTDADFTLWADWYGYGIGSVALPEPAAMLLLALGGCVLLLRRRK